MTSSRVRAATITLLMAALAAFLSGPVSASQYPPDPDEAPRGPSSSPEPMSEAEYSSAARLLGVDPTSQSIGRLVDQRTATARKATALAARAAGRSAPVLEVDGQIVEDGERVVAMVEPGARLRLGVCCVAPNELVTFEIGRAAVPGFRQTDGPTVLGIALTTADGAAVLDIPSPDLAAGDYDLHARTSDGVKVTNVAIVLGVVGEQSSGLDLTTIALVMLLIVSGGLFVLGLRRRSTSADAT